MSPRKGYDELTRHKYHGTLIHPYEGGLSVCAVVGLHGVAKSRDQDTDEPENCPNDDERAETLSPSGVARDTGRRVRVIIVLHTLATER